MRLLLRKILKKINLIKLFEELELEIENDGIEEVIMLCPFHQEINPSLHFSKTKGIFQCFGCKKSGNLISFVAFVKEIDYVSAMEYLKRKAGISDKVTKKELQKKWKILSKQGDKEIQKDLVNIQYPPDDLESLPRRGLFWLRNRKIKLSTVKEFKISFAMKGYYRHRAIIPVYNEKGKYQFFEARLLGQTNEKIKVLYPSKAPVSENLFNLYKAKLMPSYVLLVEGTLDVLYLSQLGYNAVGCFGTSLSPKQISLLTKYFQTIYLCLDSDRAGKEATLEMIENLLPLVSLKIIQLPNGKDPDQISSSFFHIFFKQAIEAEKFYVVKEMTKLRGKLRR